MEKDKLVKLAYDLGIVRRDVAENFVETVYKEAKKDYSFTHAQVWIKRIENEVNEERKACANLLLHTNLGALRDNPMLQHFIANILNEVAKAIMSRNTEGKTYEH